MLGVIIGAAVATSILGCSSAPSGPGYLPSGGAAMSDGVGQSVQQDMSRRDYFCEYCNSYLEAGTWVCPNCGAPVNRRSIAPPQTQQKVVDPNPEAYNPDVTQHTGSFAGSKVPFVPVEAYEPPPKRSLFGRKKK